MKFCAVFLAVGSFLFFQVWWPIQAERYQSTLRRLRGEIAQKKSELNALNGRYNTLTSLTALDQWAKSHGPWRSPSPHDLITIPK